MSAPPGVTPGKWTFAADSYGKVRHSRKACVYTVSRNPDGAEQLVTIAARIPNWEDAKLIAAAPYMYRVLSAVHHQMTQGEAAELIDGDVAVESESAGPFPAGTVGNAESEARRDLRWCVRELGAVLASLRID